MSKVRVYLGEVETTRRIKKVVLDGSEAWETISSGNTKYFRFILARIGTNVPEIMLSSHFVNADITSLTSIVGCRMLASSGQGYDYCAIRPDAVSGMDVTAWKTYLQQQYAAGTPVCVWYVLAEPETGIVNEPLMKIGDYADTLSKEQAGVTIPTNNGSTTVDVDTTVKPSEVYIKYMG